MTVAVPTRKQFRILLVDDSTMVLMAEALLLEQLGYQVFTADNAYRALQLLSEHPIDFVMTDIQMPFICGDELSYLIHRRFPKLPIVAITSAELADIQMIEQAYFDDILPKPLTSDHMGRIIKSLKGYD